MLHTLDINCATSDVLGEPLSSLRGRGEGEELPVSAVAILFSMGGAHLIHPRKYTWALVGVARFEPRPYC